MQKLFGLKFKLALGRCNQDLFRGNFDTRNFFPAALRNLAPVVNAGARHANQDDVFTGVLAFDNQMVDRTVFARSCRLLHAYMGEELGQIILAEIVVHKIIELVRLCEKGRLWVQVRSLYGIQ